VNWMRDRWLILGLGSIVAGYLMLGVMEQGTAASILLVAGYCVLVPAHLWSRYRRDMGE